MAMDIEFDTREMRKFADELAKAGDKAVRQELGTFLRREARKQLAVVRAQTGRKITRRTGNYAAGLKVGRRYKARIADTYAQRVYAGKPAYHASLIEFGHKLSGAAARSGASGFVPGKQIFAEAHDEFHPTFERDAEEWVTDLLREKIG